MLSLAEHLLDCLKEESGEVIQAACKATRFSLDDNYLDETPRQAIVREVIDFFAVVQLLEQHGVFTLPTGPERLQMIHAKQDKVINLLTHARRKGALEP